jgi:hypothetical protein
MLQQSHFYSVSDDATAGVSPAAVYSYIDGIYENYDFAYWMNDEGEAVFTEDAEFFKGHPLNSRIAMTGSWETINNGLYCGIRGTAQGNTMHFKNMTSSDKVILTFTKGYIRSYNSGSNFGYGSTQTDLASGTVYSTDNGTNRLWDRNKDSGKYGIFTKVQVVTTSYTWASGPTIAFEAHEGEATTVTITPGKIRDTDGDAVVSTTYITTDGSDPTDSENEARLTSLTSVPSSTTVKAASLYEGVYSPITTQYVPVDETLNPPTVTITDMMTATGGYSPKYSLTWNNTGMGGEPSVTLSATFNGSPVDVSDGYYIPATAGTLVVTATADNYFPNSIEQTVYAGVYTCVESTPDFNEIAMADLGTTLGGTWTDDSSKGRWAYWSTTGGMDADLTPNNSDSYAQYKLTDAGSVNVGSWFTFTRNRGSDYLSMLAGYGLGE